MKSAFFAKTGITNVAVKWRMMEISESEFQLEYIIWVQIYSKFEDLLNTSLVISKKNLEQRGMLHQDYQPFGPKQNCQDTLTITTYYKDARALLVTFKDVSILVIATYVSHSGLVCLDDLE